MWSIYAPLIHCTAASCYAAPPLIPSLTLPLRTSLAWRATFRPLSRVATTFPDYRTIMSLPIIDFSSPNRLATAKMLTEAMETVGFVYLDNVPGFNKEVEEKLHKAANWFFSLPLDEKLRLSPKNWNPDAEGVYRGYVPISEADNHLREQYEMGEILPGDDPDRNSGNPIYEPTPLPHEENLPFRELMYAHYYAMVNAGMEFLRLLAIGMELDEHEFDERFRPKSVSTLRIMHYPTYQPKSESTLTCEEHIDTVFVTLLASFNYSGLEILRDDGTWMSVAPRPGSLAVNIGDLLSRLTKGRFKATYHRVQDIGQDRYSMPFFFEPRSNAKFEFSDGSIITYGPWMIQRLRRHKYQFAHLPDFP